MHIRITLKQILATLLLIALAAAIPFTLSQLRKRQELRQRAAGETVTPLLTPNSATKNVGEAFDAALTLNASGNDITGVDVRLTTSKDVVEIVSFQPSPTFPNELIKRVDKQTGTLRYVAVNTTAAPLTGSVPIGTVTFRAKAQGTSPVTLLQDTQITALGHLGKLPTNPLAASYTVAAPTATPVPTETPTPIPSPTPTIEPTATPTPIPTNTPTPTPIPTNTPTPTPIPTTTPTGEPTPPPSPTGEPTATPVPRDPNDVNNDGCVTLVDLILTRTVYRGRHSQPNQPPPYYTPDGKEFFPDVNNQDGVTLLDVQLVRRAYRSAPPSCTPRS